jgi:hypothetical protein
LLRGWVEVALAFMRTLLAGAAGSTATLRDVSGSDSHATHTVARSGGGQASRSAIVLRFCTIAAGAALNAFIDSIDPKMG